MCIKETKHAHQVKEIRKYLLIPWAGTISHSAVEINMQYTLKINDKNFHTNSFMESKYCCTTLPRSSIFGIVAETARKRTWERELNFISGLRASIFILLTIASKAAPRGSFNRWTSSISTRAMSLKKLKPPSFMRYRVTASNFYRKEKECI